MVSGNGWRVSFVLFAALAAWGAVQAANAQASICGQYTCVDETYFDADLGDWELSQYGAYMVSDTLTIYGSCAWWEWNCTPPSTSATGYLSFTARTDYPNQWPVLHKTLHLSSGEYRVLLRATGTYGREDVLAHGAKRVEVIVRPQGYMLADCTPYVGYCSSGMLQGADSLPNKMWEELVWSAGSTYDDHGNLRVTENLWIPGDGDYEIYLSFTDMLDNGMAMPGVEGYVDFINIVSVGNIAPTITPGPTLMPMATPLPQVTPYCRVVTPMPQGALTPTATSVVTNSVLIHETFAGSGMRYWQQMGPNINWVQVSSEQDGTGSMRLYDSNESGLASNSIIGLPLDLPLTELWLDGRVLASPPIQPGEWMRLSIWVNDGGWIWYQNVDISNTYWRPFHAHITGEAITAIAITVADGCALETCPATSALVDGLYVYSQLANAPACTGTFNVDDSNLDQLLVLASKPCPAPVLNPNNFWGPLLKGLTLWLDWLFALSPSHEPGSTLALANAMFSSPLVLPILIVNALFDFRGFLATIIVILGIEATMKLPELIRIIKNLLPFN